jgi:hypothetical protein
MVTRILESAPNVNGTTARKAKVSRKPSVRRKPVKPSRRMGYVCGIVACFVLALSVGHCTDALVALTGASVVAAFLLAVGIDCGLVACELASLTAGPEAKAACHRVVVGSVVLSVLLNGFAGWCHGGLLGTLLAAVPIIVYGLGQAAGKLIAGR